MVAFYLTSMNPKFQYPKKNSVYVLIVIRVIFNQPIFFIQYKGHTYNIANQTKATFAAGFFRTFRFISSPTVEEGPNVETLESPHHGLANAPQTHNAYRFPTYVLADRPLDSIHPSASAITFVYLLSRPLI